MRRRRGFTLVELLVATALVVFVMVILTEAFTASMGAFSKLKGLGDMDVRLRTVTSMLRGDLRENHMIGSSGARSPSDTDFWTGPSGGPPVQGFFRIWQGTVPTGAGAGPLPFYENEGADGDGLPSRRAVDHILHFTVQKSGSSNTDFFYAQIPRISPPNPPPGSPLWGLLTGPADSEFMDPDLGTYTSHWAEIAYFMRPNGAFVGQTPLFALYRRQLLVYPGTAPGIMLTDADLPFYRDLSIRQTGWGPNVYQFNTPADLTMPFNRFGMARTGPLSTTNAGELVGTPSVTDPPGPGGMLTYPTLGDVDPARRGDDLLLSDILSFEVKVKVDSGALTPDPDPSAFVPLSRVIPTLSTNPVLGLRCFDTWSTTTPYTWGSTDAQGAPLRISIRAVQITIRVWDFKTQQARQVSLVHKL